MRPDPKRLIVIKRFCAVIEGINPTNEDPGDPDGGNYDIDLRTSVLRGRKIIGRETPLPCIAVNPNPKPEPVAGVGYGKTERTEEWYLAVQGFTPDDKVNPTDKAEILMAVVQQRLARITAVSQKGDRDIPLYPDDYLLGGLIIDMSVGQGVASAPDAQVSPTAFFYLPVCLTLATNISNPFAT